MSRYRQTMRDVLSEMVEKFSPKEIKMAIGIASDKRYAGGNMTGAVNAIEKIKKGLSKHKQVAAVLKRQNEDIQESGHDDVASAKNQVKVAMSALQKMETELGKLNDEDSLPTWWTNKVAVSVDKLDGMADYLDTQVEEVELDEGKMKQFHQMMDDGKSAQETTFDLKTVKELMKEEIELDEKREPFAVIDTADGNKVVGTASDEKGAKSIITSAELPPIKIKDKKTLKIVKVKKKQDIGYPLKEGTWHIPDTPKLKSGLKKLMSKPIKLGKEGDDATNKIGEFIGDDELYDDLYVAGKKNPNGDARDVIKKAMKRLGIKEEVELDEAKEVLSRFKDDKLKKSIMNLATQKGLKVKEMGDKLEVSGNARKVMDLTLAVQKHDVKIEQNIMSAYTAAITKGVK